MKEQLAWQFIGLLKLIAIWIVIVVVAVVLATQMASWPLRILLVVAALASVPIYVYVRVRQEDARRASFAESRTAEAQQKSSNLWAELCKRPPELTVRATVPPGPPVDLLVIEHATTYLQIHRVNPHLPEAPATSVCWMDPPATRCVHPNIANVQSAYLLDPPSSTPTGPDGKPAYRRWNFSIAEQARCDVPLDVKPRYELRVAEPERVALMIERFRVTVVDTQGWRDKVLAETVIHRKSWLGPHRRSPAGVEEARYCPERDLAIGKMLEAVFPVR